MSVPESLDLDPIEPIEMMEPVGAAQTVVAPAQQANETKKPFGFGSQAAKPAAADAALPLDERTGTGQDDFADRQGVRTTEAFRAPTDRSQDRSREAREQGTRPSRKGG